MPGNESRIKAAGIRMALKLIPDDMLDQAPAALEKYLLGQLTEVEPDRHEAGACYVIAPDDTDSGLRIMLCTMDEQCAVSRIVKETKIPELFRQILEELKDM